MKDSFKKDLVTSETSETGQNVNKDTKLTKPAKVPSWTKDMSLEIWLKQIATWT